MLDSMTRRLDAVLQQWDLRQMGWLRRVLGMSEDGWPTRTPPTVPPGRPAVFHCPAWKAVVPSEARACPACGKQLTDGG
jgi:hypothetical protein